MGVEHGGGAFRELVEEEDKMGFRVSELLEQFQLSLAIFGKKMKLYLARSSGPDINNILDILEQECFLTKTKYYHVHVGIKWEVMMDI